MGGRWIRGDGMCGENLAGLGIRNSVAMLSGVSDVANADLVECPSESFDFVVRVDDGSDVDKCSSGLWPEGIPTKDLASESSVP